MSMNYAYVQAFKHNFVHLWIVRNMIQVQSHIKF